MRAWVAVLLAAVALPFLALLLDREPEWVRSEHRVGTGHKRVLMVLPDEGFDPTEAAAPFLILRAQGHSVVLATETGAPPRADPLVVNGYMLGLLGAKGANLAAYRAMEASPEASPTRPIKWSDADPAAFDALILPGGHAPEMVAYLSSPVVHDIARAFVAGGKPVGAICHGVLVLTRAGLGKEFGLEVTTVHSWMETIAHYLTYPFYGGYHLSTTGGNYTQREVERSGVKSFASGPTNPLHTLYLSTEHDHSRSFTVKHGNILTARFFGDAWAFGERFSRML
jgi:putative intracellular protease/amidase